MTSYELDQRGFMVLQNVKQGSNIRLQTEGLNLPRNLPEQGLGRLDGERDCTVGSTSSFMSLE